MNERVSRAGPQIASKEPPAHRLANIQHPETASARVNYEIAGRSRGLNQPRHQFRRFRMWMAARLLFGPRISNAVIRPHVLRPNRLFLRDHQIFGRAPSPPTHPDPRLVPGYQIHDL